MARDLATLRQTVEQLRSYSARHHSVLATTLRLFVALIACLCRSGVKKQICTNRTEKRNERRGLVCRNNVAVVQ
jgi:hypothetical protein